MRVLGAVLARDQTKTRTPGPNPYRLTVTFGINDAESVHQVAVLMRALDQKRQDIKIVVADVSRPLW